jgi:hypothetical protein
MGAERHADPLGGAIADVKKIIHRYNAKWLIERLGHQASAGARAAAWAETA